MVTPRCEWSHQGESHWLAAISPRIKRGTRGPVLNREPDHSDQIATIYKSREPRFESLTTRLRLHVEMLAQNKKLKEVTSDVCPACSH
jgi:hypothetical protein